MGLTVLLLVTALPLLAVGMKDYTGYQLLNIPTSTQEDVDFLRSLQVDMKELDFWIEPSTFRDTKVLVPPSELAEFKGKLSQKGLSFVVLNDDINSLVQKGSEPSTNPDQMKRSRAFGHLVDHTDFHRYDKIVSFLTVLRNWYPALTNIFTLKNKTFEGREVMCIYLGNTFSAEAGNKRAIIMEFGIHAREWISPSTALFFIDHVLARYANGDSDARFLLDNFDWYIVPSTNPDGYEYSHTNERFWRKNRRVFPAGCTGVDLNRNFDAKWGTTGISRDCSSDIYLGPRAFSEIETQNIRDLVMNTVGDRLYVYLSIHSFSQLLLVPWGYTTSGQRPSDYVELDRVGEEMRTAISNTHRKTYYYGTAYDLLNYAASGASEDWAKTVKSDIYSYCYELRPDSWYGINGFAITADNIIPQGEEFYESIVKMAELVK